MMQPEHERLSVRRQCELLGLARSGVYYQPVEVSAEELALMKRIDALHLSRPFYGSRQITLALRRRGEELNRKRVQRLMRVMGLWGQVPGPHTSEPHPEHIVYPYLLRGLDIVRPDRVVVYGVALDVCDRYAVEGLRSLAETKQVIVVAGLPDELPMVTGDPYRLRQMIGNLIENAIKYTPLGGQVEISAEAEGDQVILRVRDNGPGIPPADQPYLFDKFFRASNVPEESTGTGLGLSIVKSIVDNHQGRIWVDSKLGAGTVFTVVLPRAEV